MYDFTKLVESQLDDLNCILETLKCEVDFVRSKGLVFKTVKGKKYYYYQEPGKGRKQVYLGKAGSDKVLNYMDNRYKFNQFITLESNRKLLSEVLDNYKIESLIREENGINNLKKPKDDIIIRDVYLKLDKWAAEPYEINPMGNRNAESICVDGKKVRSKGESSWYNCLCKYGIPVRYECALTLIDMNGKETVVYPDFLIKCLDGSYIIIEHCGMLLDDSYGDRIKRKIRVYLKNGYTIGDNLIIFSDNANGGINTQAIENIVKRIIFPRVFGKSFCLL